jgi:hypothetical protein
MATKQPPKPRKPARAAPPTRPSAAKAAPFNANARAEVSAEEIRQLIEEAAYYKAKERGFQPGHELDDWFEAEAEVRRRLEGAA